jgi:hypothetical protein
MWQGASPVEIELFTQLTMGQTAANFNDSRLVPQAHILDCGGKRSATPLLVAASRTESGVAATLCHRSSNLCRPGAKLQD